MSTTLEIETGGAETTSHLDPVVHRVSRQVERTVKEDRELFLENRAETIRALFSMLRDCYKARTSTYTVQHGDRTCGAVIFATRTPDRTMLDEVYEISDFVDINPGTKQGYEFTESYKVEMLDSEGTHNTILLRGDELTVTDENGQLVHDTSRVDEVFMSFIERTNIALGTYEMRSDEERAEADAHVRSMMEARGINTAHGWLPAA